MHFSSGYSSVKDKPHSIWPCTAVTPKNEIAFGSRPALACGELLCLGFKSLQTEDYGGGKHEVGLGIAILWDEVRVAFPFSK